MIGLMAAQRRSNDALQLIPTVVAESDIFSDFEALTKALPGTIGEIQAKPVAAGALDRRGRGSETQLSVCDCALGGPCNAPVEVRFCDVYSEGGDVVADAHAEVAGEHVVGRHARVQHPSVQIPAFHLQSLAETRDGPA